MSPVRWRMPASLFVLLGLASGVKDGLSVVYAVYTRRWRLWKEVALVLRGVGMPQEMCAMSALPATSGSGQPEIIDGRVCIHGHRLAALDPGRLLELCIIVVLKDTLYSISRETLDYGSSDVLLGLFL